MPIHQYSIKFRTLAAASRWNEPSLLTAFRQGLNSRLRLQLTAFDDTYGLEKLIQLAIRCSNRLQSCSVESSVAIATPPIRQPEISDPPEPMQTDCNRLSSTERRRRLTEGLCLYCGASDHKILECPLRPPRALVSTIRPPITKMNPLSTCAQLTVGDFVVSVTTLLDYGSAGNFIAGDLCRQLRLPSSVTETAYEIQSITGKPLTRRHVKHSVGPLQLQIGQLHQEELHLQILEGSTVDIILGRPWLVQHDPHLSWKTGEILKWGNSCFPYCFPRLPRPLTSVPVQLPIHSTSFESPIEKQSVNVPCQLFPLQWRFLPQESCPASTASAMRLCDRSIPGWASTSWKDLPFITSWTEGYWGGVKTRIHRSIYIPCCLQFLLRGQKGWRPETLYRLPKTQRDHRQIPVPSSPCSNSLGTTMRSHHFHEVGPPQRS